MKRRLPWIILVVCAGLFALGLVRLFQLRFAAGDVYPPYSSLRADPLGTMALAESLERHLSVRRDFSVNNRLPETKDTAYLHLAARAEDWERLPAEVMQEVQAFLARGGRLAITFYPETSNPLRRVPFTLRKSKAATNASPAQAAAGMVSVKQRWGLEFGFVALRIDDEALHVPATAVNRTDLPLPESLDWHSGLVFTNLDSSWQVIYERGSNAVVAERRFGPGTVVLASDSYFLSNEALLKDRHASLLSWLVGPSRHVVFDEAHLGITETPGVTTLMRKYRLHGLAAGLVLLIGLFIWKHSFPFVPPQPDAIPAGYVAGKETGAGFVNLLRRNIPAGEVLKVCFAEWTRSLAQGHPHLIARVDKAQAAIEAELARPARERTPVRTYREIAQLLKGKTK